MDAIHAVRTVIEKARANKQALWMVFIDLEKAFDRVPRPLIWQALRAHNIPEYFVKLIQDTYSDARTAVRSPAGLSESFDVKVGVHQGSALSPLLFNIVMNYLTATIQKPVPWNMLYADDVVLLSDSKQDIQENLEQWRRALESGGLRISRSKTEYMVCHFNQTRHLDTEVTLDNIKLPQVHKFKYLGSMIADDGTIEADVTNRITTAWIKWRSLTGVLCDTKIPVRTKGKVYKTAVRPAITHRQKLHTTEMRMLRWSVGVTMKDKVRNEHIRGSLKIAPIADKMVEARLRWYGHVIRRPEDYVVKKCLSYATQKRQRGRPLATWLTTVQKDMKNMSLTVDDTENRTKWRRMIRKADPV
ncbi:hypothetical protein ABMA27_003133 [Loxostege sticticalis]|uniref:Reverse transcriptase domain-containing protein n=1 Tax=Loxostege sticticalis TaxID=481309 RepID=A0ABR3HS36_LOXSC